MPSPHLRENLPFSPAELVVRYSLEQRVGHLADAFESPVSLPVGWARVTIVARDYGVNLYEVFDAIDGDHETVAAALFDPSEGDLAEDLEERYPLMMGDVLLCERTWIKPQYRGHKLGLLIKAMSISAPRSRAWHRGDLSRPVRG
jgi:hypothetical protein